MLCRQLPPIAFLIRSLPLICSSSKKGNLHCSELYRTDVFYVDIENDKVVFFESNRQTLIRKTLNVGGRDKSSFLILKKSAKNICRMLNMKNEVAQIIFDSTFIRLEYGDMIIVVRQTEGKYPNYNLVIPSDNNKQCILDKDDFASVIKRTMVFALETLLDKYSFSQGALNVSAQDIGLSLFSIETMFIEYTGDSIEIGFKSSSPVNILQIVPDKMIKLEMSDS